MISIRTDLAIEAKQAYTEENKRELDKKLIFIMKSIVK